MELGKRKRRKKRNSLGLKSPKGQWKGWDDSKKTEIQWWNRRQGDVRVLGLEVTVGQVNKPRCVVRMEGAQDSTLVSTLGR